jgi:cytochrome c-type biogenesis protein
MELTFAAAFLAGLVSFLTPCTLPLVPGYVAMISGLSAEALRRGEALPWKKVIANALLFVAGFSTLFIALGASAGVVGRFLSAHRAMVNEVAGASIVFFGLTLAGVVRFGFLSRDVRYHGPIASGPWRSLLLGLAFALGWTPCAGPALVAMLLMAATGYSVWRGTQLLAVYSAGLAVPFVLVALSVSRFLSVYRKWQRYLVWSERVGGALLVGVGALVFFDKLGDASLYVTRSLSHWGG